MAILVHHTDNSWYGEIEHEVDGSYVVVKDGCRPGIFDSRSGVVVGEIWESGSEEDESEGSEEIGKVEGIESKIQKFVDENIWEDVCLVISDSVDVMERIVEVWNDKRYEVIGGILIGEYRYDIWNLEKEIRTGEEWIAECEERLKECGDDGGEDEERDERDECLREIEMARKENDRERRELEGLKVKLERVEKVWREKRG